ncbi:MAG: hypothetical protein WBP81_24845 [Solirubrobacteraceae bacterium]
MKVPGVKPQLGLPALLELALSSESRGDLDANLRARKVRDTGVPREFLELSRGNAL